MEQTTFSKYDRIRSFLLEEALKPESRLKMPTVQELMRKFGASQSPVTRAIRDLEREGVVRCRRGSGMVSCSAAAREESFPEELAGSGKAVLYLRTDYFAESLWNMEHTILSYARQLKIPIINHRIERESNLIAIIESVGKARELAGIVMNSDPGAKSEELIGYLNRLPCPVVMINSSNLYENAAENVTILSLDSEEAGRLCIRALARAGHTKVGYIRNEPECDLTRLRFTGVTAEAEELGVDYVLAKDLQASNLESILERMDQFLYQCDDTYITVCSDVFSSAFAPGVSAPQSLGLDPEVVLPLIKHVLRTRKVRGFDICEISPRFDQDNTTANLGAVIIFAVVNTLCRLNGLGI